MGEVRAGNFQPKTKRVAGRGKNHYTTACTADNTKKYVAGLADVPESKTGNAYFSEWEN